MIVTPTEIAELFAEAQRLAPQHPEGRWHVVRLSGAPRVISAQCRAARVAVRTPGRALKPAEPPYAVQPLPAERVQTCACGGYLELRQGLRRPVHVGPRGCRARLTV